MTLGQVCSFPEPFFSSVRGRRRQSHLLQGFCESPGRACTEHACSAHFSYSCSHLTLGHQQHPLVLTCCTAARLWSCALLRCCCCRAAVCSMRCCCCAAYICCRYWAAVLGCLCRACWITCEGPGRRRQRSAAVSLTLCRPTPSATTPANPSLPNCSEKATRSASTTTNHFSGRHLCLIYLASLQCIAPQNGLPCVGDFKAAHHCSDSLSGWWGGCGRQESFKSPVTLCPMPITLPFPSILQPQIRVIGTQRR